MIREYITKRLERIVFGRNAFRFIFTGMTVLSPQAGSFVRFGVARFPTGRKKRSVHKLLVLYCILPTPSIRQTGWMVCLFLYNIRLNDAPILTIHPKKGQRKTKCQYIISQTENIVKISIFLTQYCFLLWRLPEKYVGQKRIGYGFKTQKNSLKSAFTEMNDPQKEISAGRKKAKNKSAFCILEVLFNQYNKKQEMSNIILHKTDAAEIISCNPPKFQYLCVNIQSKLTGGMKE